MSGPYVVYEKLFSISIRCEAICVKSMQSSLSFISKTSQTYRYLNYYLLECSLCYFFLIFLSQGEFKVTEREFTMDDLIRASNENRV